MNNNPVKFLLLFILGIFLLGSGLPDGQSLFAQSPDSSQKPSPASPTTVANGEAKTSDKISSANIAGWNIEIGRMEKALARKGIRESDFDKIHDDATLIHDSAIKLIANLQPELKTLRERFAELGPIPEKGQPEESKEIAAKRASLKTSLSKLDGQEKAAQLVIVKSRQVRDGIVEARRARFVRLVTSKSLTIFDPKLWQSFWQDSGVIAKGIPVLLSNISKSFSTRLEQTGSRVLLIFLAMVAWVSALYLSSRGLNRAKQRMGLISTERSLLALTAFISVLINGVIPGLFILGLVWILDSFSLFSNSSRLLVYGVAFAIAIAVSVMALAFAFLQPGSPQRRIVGLSDNASRRVIVLIGAGVIAFVISWIIYDAGRALFTSLEFGIAIKAIFALIIAALTMVSLRLIRLDRKEEAVRETGHGLSVFLNWNVLRALVGLGVVVVFLSLVTGYVALAEFAANQIMVTSSVLALLWLVLKIIEDNIVGCFQSSHSVNSAISQYLGWQSKATEQLGVVLIGVSRLMIVLMTILVLMIPWGYRARDWLDWISALFFGFKVGGINISLAVILSALVIFLVGVIVTRSLQSWLSTRLLPTTHLDSGVRNSLTQVFGYIGIVTVAMITISFAGFDLTSLAFVAGALSLGIGFGLQSIVSNFVSGLILLAERPIKAGDWIVTSGGEGTVRKISVRSTEIETFDRATVVVPNSSLITESVVNWNHRSSMGRIKLAIGVGYDSDPGRVKEILLEIAENHQGILDIPHPIVYFMEFGASSLDFELRCYLADVGNGMSVKSDLRFAIFAALAAEGIEIPFPQSDVHIKGIEPEKTKPMLKNNTSDKVESTHPVKDGE